MKKLVLETPILINGVEVRELTYDANEITSLQYSEACAASGDMSKTKAFAFKIRENDYALHMYLGFMAIIAVNPHIDLNDLERIKGLDILKISNIGFSFITGRLEAPSQENLLDEQSENIVDISTQA